jgi:DNA invertase Pin-like site-specific DNA recombinase
MTLTSAAPTATIRAAQYLRVSLDRSGHARSTDEQRADNERAVAEQPGWTLVETYRDDNRSASRYARKVREDYARLLGDLERGAFDLLILWESSRGSRKVSEWCRLIELCQERRVQVYVTSHGRSYDPANERDERSLLEDAVDSQYESGKVSKRVKRSAASNARDGLPHGRIPFGYERIYDERTKRLVEQRPMPAEATEVRGVFEQIAAGVSLRAIVADLTERGVPTRTGAPWGSQTVRQIALNLTYLGKRTHLGTVTSGVWPPLVNEETFYAVQRILTDPGRTTRKPGKAKHLLSMIARCGVCGGPMAVTYRIDGGRPTYVCKGHAHTRIVQGDLDDYITERVLFRLEQPKVWQRLTAGGDDDAALVAARGELAALEAELDELYGEVNARRLSPRALAKIEPGMLAQINAARKRVTEQATAPGLRWLLDGPQRDVALRWADAPMSARREAIRALCSIAVNRPERGHRPPARERTALDWLDH